MHLETAKPLGVGMFSQNGLGAYTGNGFSVYILMWAKLSKFKSSLSILKLWYCAGH